MDSYQEWRRDWPCEARQPAVMQGAKSSGFRPEDEIKADAKALSNVERALFFYSDSAIANTQIYININRIFRGNGKC